MQLYNLEQALSRTCSVASSRNGSCLGSSCGLEVSRGRKRSRRRLPYALRDKWQLREPPLTDTKSRRITHALLFFFSGLFNEGLLVDVRWRIRKHAVMATRSRNASLHWVADSGRSSVLRTFGIQSSNVKPLLKPTLITRLSAWCPHFLLKRGSRSSPSWPPL